MADNNRSVERALAILDCFSEGKASYTLTEISRKTTLSPSTATRLLATLEQNNYLFRDEETSKYYLGFKLARIGNVAFENLDYCKVARPYLIKLNETFNESVGLYMIKEDYRVCIDRIEGKNSLRSIVQIGDIYPLTRGASGKVLLAYQSDDVIKKCLEKDDFLKERELKEIIKNSYATSHAERTSGIISVAAPIFNSKNEVKIAIFMTIPTARGERDRINKIIKSIVESSQFISETLGYKK